MFIGELIHHSLLEGWFLIFTKGQMDSVGNTPLGRSNAAMQLINTALIAPAATQQLPITIAERNQIEHRQIRLLLAENPQVRRYKRVATLWARWIDSFGAQYPRGWQATMLRMRELVDGASDVEYSPPFVLWDLLAPVESEGSNEPVIDDPLRRVPQVVIRGVCSLQSPMCTLYLNKIQLVHVRK